MAYLLALETSSVICSVALYKKEQLMGLSELQIEKSHSSHITILIQQLLQNCQVEMRSLAAVAISGGPGSYTGLRIGSATAKGLCYSLDIPLIEVSTLEALALEGINYTPQPANNLFCPMIDARRMEVYTCLTNYQLEKLLPISPVILQPDSFADILARDKVIFIGSGAAKFAPLVHGNPNALFLENIKPTASAVGKLALDKLENKLFQNIAYYEPFYLKEVYITSSTK